MMLPMKNLIMVLFMVFVLISVIPFTEGKSEKRSLDITSLMINFDKTDAIFTVNYDFNSLSKLYILFLGSKSLEPKIKAIFSNFDYKIIKMDQYKAILRVKNISRFDKGYYLHDSHRFGESINTVLYIYTPDSSEPKKYSNRYLFNWSNIPGGDNNNLIRFLKNDIGINWVDNAKILKLDDDRVISVFTAENSIEIMLKDTKRALLKIDDGRTYDLQVKEYNGNFFISTTELYSTPDIYYLS